jgi:hypothetical protein
MDIEKSFQQLESEYYQDGVFFPVRLEEWEEESVDHIVKPLDLQLTFEEVIKSLL